MKYETKWDLHTQKFELDSARSMKERFEYIYCLNQIYWQRSESVWRKGKWHKLLSGTTEFSIY